MFCTECGKQIDDDSAFCTYCGAPVEPTPDAKGEEPQREESPKENAEEKTAPKSEANGNERRSADIAGSAPVDGPSVAESAQATAVLAADAAGQERPQPAEPPTAALPDSAFQPQTPDPHYARPAATAVMPTVPPAAQSAPTVTTAPGMPENGGRNKYRTIAIVAGVIAAILVVVCVAIVAWSAGALGGGEPEASDSQAAASSESEQSSSSQEAASSSSSAAEAPIPDVVGMEENSAVATLARAGFETADITREHSVSTPAGSVISQTPAAGNLANPETVKVSLVVSDGPQQTATEVEYTVVSQAMTWSEADAYCRRNGGTLACVGSQDEYSKVLAVAEASGLHVLWLGGYRDGSAFKWTTGEPFSFSDWGPGEPNDEGGTEDCLAMLESNGVWGWYDVPNDVSATYSNGTMGFVMQREVQRPL